MSLKESTIKQKNDGEKKRYSSPKMKEIGRVRGVTKGSPGGDLDSGGFVGTPPGAS